MDANEVPYTAITHRVLFSMLLLLAGGASVWFLADWHLPKAWIDHASVYLKAGKTLNPVDPEGLMVLPAGFLGITSGAILMAHFGGHNARVPGGNGL